MGIGIAHIITPFNAGWTAWVMLALLVCALVAENLQRGIISQSLSSLLAQGERMYKDAPFNFRAQVTMMFFRIGTIAMAVCLCAQGGRFSLAAFGAVCGLIVAILLIKWACHALLEYTFLFSRRAPLYEHYSNLMTIALVILYPVLLVLLRADSPLAARWVLAVVAGLFLTMCIYRGGRIVIHSPQAIFYFVLYITTMDVLPMAVLYSLSGQIIQTI